MDADDSCVEKTARLATRLRRVPFMPLHRIVLAVVFAVVGAQAAQAILPGGHVFAAGGTSTLGTQWTTHQGTYLVAAVSMDMPGDLRAMTVANITKLMTGAGDPSQREPSVRSSLAVIGVNLRVKVAAMRLPAARGIDTTTCSEETIGYEYGRALAHDPSLASADAVIIFTPYKPGCLSGGVTLGRVVELETPQNGWLDPRMTEHELGHALLGLAHSGVTTSVGRNVLDGSTKTGSQYGPDSVMGASPVGWSGPDQLVAGHIGMNQVVTADAGGTYTIQRRELTGNTSLPVLLRIPLQDHTGLYDGSPPEEVILEYEVQTGADSAAHSGKTQVIAQTWTEQPPPGSRLDALTWEVGRLTPKAPIFTINLAHDQVTVTEVSHTRFSVRLRVVRHRDAAPLDH